MNNVSPATLREISFTFDKRVDWKSKILVVKKLKLTPVVLGLKVNYK